MQSFFFVIDDMVDDDSAIELINQRWQIAYEFFDQLFSNRKITSKYCWQVIASQPKIDWPYFERLLSQRDLCMFRAMARIAYFLPQEPFYELMSGYKSDITADRCIQNENDLIEYAASVASSASTLIALDFCHRSNRGPDQMGSNYRIMIENVRKMGVVRSIVENYRQKCQMIDFSYILFAFPGLSNP